MVTNSQNVILVEGEDAGLVQEDDNDEDNEEEEEHLAGGEVMEAAGVTLKGQVLVEGEEEEEDLLTQAIASDEKNLVSGSNRCDLYASSFSHPSVLKCKC